MFATEDFGQHGKMLGGKKVIDLCN